MRQSSDDFYAGILAALAIVSLHNNQTIFDEIVASCDINALVGFAIKDDSFEWSGLKRYGYSQRLQEARR